MKDHYSGENDIYILLYITYMFANHWTTETILAVALEQLEKALNYDRSDEAIYKEKATKIYKEVIEAYIKALNS